MIDRRQFMATATAFGAALNITPLSAATRGKAVKFPKGFIWGTATAAYQIEGAAEEDGRTPSIWDTFSHTPGKTKLGHTGDVATDSYHRWREDIVLIKSLGLKSYRFSLAWPRIQPHGKGPANQRGLDHYKRMIDGMLELGLRPLPTLYHWDLPQALEDDGGWPARDTANRFAEYSAIVARALADRVPEWGLFNEPKTFTGVGYNAGAHAPGRRDEAAFIKSTHVVNIAYGLASRAMRAIRSDLKLGNALDVSMGYAATNSAKDLDALKRWDAYNNLWFLVPTLTGRYPEGVLPEDRLMEALGFQPGDEALLKAKLDWIGINYYSPHRLSFDPGGRTLMLNKVRAEWAVAPGKQPKTDIGWDVYAPGFAAVLKRVGEVSGSIPIEITENGAAFNTPPSKDGRIRDVRRISYLDGHLRAVHDAIQAGVPIRGYHHWRLLDNFEWAEGYTQRFGMVWVDFDKGLERTVKDSGHWFAAAAKRNGLLAG